MNNIYKAEVCNEKRLASEGIEEQAVSKGFEPFKHGVDYFYSDQLAEIRKFAESCSMHEVYIYVLFLTEHKPDGEWKYIFSLGRTFKDDTI